MALFKKGRLCFEREESFDQIGAKNRHEGGGTGGGEVEGLNHIHSILTVDVWTKIQATTTMMETMTMKSKKAHYTDGFYLITDLTQFMEQTWEITYD